MRRGATGTPPTSLVSDGLEIDKKGKADLDLFTYDGAGAAAHPHPGHRLHALLAGVPVPQDPGSTTGHNGGYTYADYAKVIGLPEVHADGEIWGQTLWSLRDKVGSRVALSLVTRAMELAPSNPSYLDMRNALLVADTAHYQGKYHAQDLEHLRQPRHGLLRRVPRRRRRGTGGRHQDARRTRSRRAC